MITLELPENFAWKKLLALYKNSHCLEPTERADPKEGVLEGIVELPQPFWYRLEPLGGPLQLSLTAPDGANKPTKQDYLAARAWAVRRLWLGLDYEALRDALEVSFLGYSLSGEFWPVMSPAYTSYWAALLRIYCGRKLDTTLRETLGEKVAFGGKTYALLPRPEQMMGVSGLELQALGLSSWSSRKVSHISQVFLHDDEVQLEHLPTDPEAALKLITKRLELGGTSAAWVLMRGAMHPDVPLEGGHIRRALGEGLGLEKTPKLKEYLELLRPHAPFRSFASYYLHLSQIKLWRKDWTLD